MTEKKIPLKPTMPPVSRPGGTFDGGSVKTQKSFTTNNVPGKIGKPKPTSSGGGSGS